MKIWWEVRGRRGWLGGQQTGVNKILGLLSQKKSYTGTVQTFRLNQSLDSFYCLINLCLFLTVPG